MKGKIGACLVADSVLAIIQNPCYSPIERIVLPGPYLNVLNVFNHQEPLGHLERDC